MDLSDWTDRIVAEAHKWKDAEGWGILLTGFVIGNMYMVRKRRSIVIGRKEDERLATRTRRFSEAWSEFARAVDLTELQIDPDAIFGDVRAPRPGRDVQL